MKKLFALSATTVAALALTACQPSSSSTSAASAPPVKSTTAPATKAPTHTKNTKPSTSNQTAKPSTASKSTHTTQTGGTKVSYVWPDSSSWNITNANHDICADIDSEASPSPFGVFSGQFTCGTMSASLDVCKKEKGGNVLCILDYPQREAVRFRSDVTGTENPGNRYASPLQAVLTDGVTCDPVSIDQAEHPVGRASWLWCSDGSALLTKDDGTGGYFNTSNKTWTAERSFGKNAPVVTPVKAVAYAG